MANTYTKVNLLSIANCLKFGNVCSSSAGNSTPHPASNKPVTTPMEDDSGLFDIKPKIEPSRAMDYDDSKIDDDLDKLLQHIKEEQQNSMVSDITKTQIKW